MNAKAWIFLKGIYLNYSGVFYCAFILAVFHFVNNYVVLGIGPHLLLYSIYYLLSGVFLFGMFKMSASIANSISAIILPFIMLGLLGYWLLLLPIPGIIAFYFVSRRWRPVFISITVVLLLVYGCIGFLALIFWNFGKTTTLGQMRSPNGQYILVSVARDEGALGGEVEVIAEKIFYPMDILTFFKQGNRILYTGEWDEKPVVAWVDDNTVSIDERKYSVK